MFSENHINDWTILFVIYVELDEKKKGQPFELELLRVLNLIRKSSLSKGTQILVLINKVSYTYQALNIPIEKEKTILWQVVPWTQERNKFRIIYEAATSFFLQDVEAIGEILKRLNSNKFDQHDIITKAKRYLVVTYGHGSAFGIFKRKIIYRDESKDKDQKWSFLSNKLLAQALNTGFGEKKVDILLMYNCIMMNLHTTFHLKDCVEYLIAPQTMISAPGFNYVEIIKSVNDATNDAKAVAKICVTSIPQQPHSLKQVNKINEWAIFCFQLSLFKPIIENFETITSILLSLFQSDPRIRSLAIIGSKSLLQFDQDLGYHQVDFLLWLQHFINDLCEEGLRDHPLLIKLIGLKDIFILTLSRAKIAELIGSEIYKVEMQAGIERKNPTGASIFFPTSQNEFKVASKKSEQILNDAYQKFEEPFLNFSHRLFYP